MNFYTQFTTYIIASRLLQWGTIKVLVQGELSFLHNNYTQYLLVISYCSIHKHYFYPVYIQYPLIFYLQSYLESKKARQNPILADTFAVKIVFILSFCLHS